MRINHCQCVLFSVSSFTRFSCVATKSFIFPPNHKSRPHKNIERWHKNRRKRPLWLNLIIHKWKKKNWKWKFWNGISHLLFVIGDWFRISLLRLFFSLNWITWKSLKWMTCVHSITIQMHVKLERTLAWIIKWLFFLFRFDSILSLTTFVARRDKFPFTLTLCYFTSIKPWRLATNLFFKNHFEMISSIFANNFKVSVDEKRFTDSRETVLCLFEANIVRRGTKVCSFVACFHSTECDVDSFDSLDQRAHRQRYGTFLSRIFSSSAYTVRSSTSPSMSFFGHEWDSLFSNVVDCHRYVSRRMR